MLMKLLGIFCAITATSTVLVYGFGLQVQRPIAPLVGTQSAPATTPKSPVVASVAPIHAPAVIPEANPELNSELNPEPTLEPSQEPIQESTPVLAAHEQSVFEQATVSSEIAVDVEPAIAELLVVEATVDQVFVFWQPFRSRGSAQGFAQGLSARAEVPISVISEETESGRQYRVVLPYDSESQRLERLAKLESATRLEMGE